MLPGYALEMTLRNSSGRTNMKTWCWTRINLSHWPWFCSYIPSVFAVFSVYTVFSVAHESIRLKHTLLPLTLRYCWVMIGLLCLLSPPHVCALHACLRETESACFLQGFVLQDAPNAEAQLSTQGLVQLVWPSAQGNALYQSKARRNMVWSVFGHSHWTQWILTAVGLGSWKYSRIIKAGFPHCFWSAPIEPIYMIVID